MNIGSPTKTNPVRLEKRIGQAAGPDGRIDKSIAAMLDGGKDKDAIPPYTASVDECIALIKRTLPAWHWHVGHGPSGVVPYASMSRSDGDADPILAEARAPTVPLALLGALIKALDRK